MEIAFRITTITTILLLCRITNNPPHLMHLTASIIYTDLQSPITDHRSPPMTSSPFEEHFNPVEQIFSLSEHSSTKLARLNTEHCVVLHTQFSRDVRRRRPPSSSNSTQLLIPTLPIHLPCSDYTITLRTTLTTTFCLTLHTGSHTHFFLSFFSNKELKNNSKVWLQCLAPVFVSSLPVCHLLHHLSHLHQSYINNQ